MKSWMKKRRGETENERRDRLSKTCYFCGLESKTYQECNVHEGKCQENKQ